ncbi:hypothetical protein [Herpetosiphon giganteus]|uniref:hypothetical protein n=1 Tax=Herpetosiphon giganteus TaxID=2029754 RepID=UPI00195ED5E4|nr:hypothetical protein [Herpetosiphon giganteus]MBM7841763.1 hypothetical protein [Herpetosiphon giganteus]
MMQEYDLSYQRQHDLLDHLAELATWWRAANIARRPMLVEAYHETLDELYGAGWNAELAPQQLLPPWLMPDCYLAKYPQPCATDAQSLHDLFGERNCAA